MKQFIICPNCGAIELEDALLCKCIGVAKNCSNCNRFDILLPAKAISIKQPYSYLTASGICDIINSKRKTNFRGRVLIHAGAKSAKNIDFGLFSLDQLEWMSANGKPFSKLSTSAIIGSVEIVDCVINHKSIWAEKTTVYATIDGSGEHYDQSKLVYNWVLANPVLFEKPVLNVKGKLSFFIPEIL